MTDSRKNVPLLCEVFVIQSILENSTYAVCTSEGIIVAGDINFVSCLRENVTFAV